jgi:hypothetical protein
MHPADKIVEDSRQRTIDAYTRIAAIIDPTDRMSVEQVVQHIRIMEYGTRDIIAKMLAAAAKGGV